MSYTARCVIECGKPPAETTQCIGCQEGDTVTSLLSYQTTVTIA